MSCIRVRGVRRFRVICWRICTHSWWGNFILLCIMVSSGVLAAEDPLRADSPRNNVRPMDCPYLQSHPTFSYLVSIDLISSELSECTVIGCSHGEPVRELCSDPVCRGFDQFWCTQFRYEMRSVTQLR